MLSSHREDHLYHHEPLLDLRPLPVPGRLRAIEAELVARARAFELQLERQEHHVREEHAADEPITPFKKRYVRS